MSKGRLFLGAIGLSAAGLLALVTDEGYTDRAVIPVPGDVPTVGFGTTAGVKLGDTTTPVKALGRVLRDVDKFEGAIKRCVTVPLAPYEYDAYVRLAYNIGPANFCGSTLVKRLNAEDYASACEHIEDFICGPATESERPKQGEPCFSTKKPLKVYQGLANRRARERATCEGKP